MPGYLTQREKTSAVALAYWVPSEAIGSAIQLVINLSAIVVAGTLTLLVLGARAELQTSRERNKAHRITVSLLVLALVVSTHIFVEPPAHIYRTWAENGSPYGALARHPNVRNLASPTLGVIAVIWMLLLATSLAALPLLIWREQSTGHLFSNGTPTGPGGRELTGLGLRR